MIFDDIGTSHTGSVYRVYQTIRSQAVIASPKFAQYSWDTQIVVLGDSLVAASSKTSYIQSDSSSLRRLQERPGLGFRWYFHMLVPPQHGCCTTQLLRSMVEAWCSILVRFTRFERNLGTLRLPLGPADSRWFSGENRSSEVGFASWHWSLVEPLKSLARGCSQTDDFLVETAQCTVCSTHFGDLSRLGNWSNNSIQFPSSRAEGSEA